jgi:hypothetical protein
MDHHFCMSDHAVAHSALKYIVCNVVVCVRTGTETAVIQISSGPSLFHLTVSVEYPVFVCL